MTDLNLAVIRRLLSQRIRIDADIHNVTVSMFQPGTKVQYQIAERSYFGAVVRVNGFAGCTSLRVLNLQTKKERNVDLSDITGIVQET